MCHERPARAERTVGISLKEQSTASGAEVTYALAPTGTRRGSPLDDASIHAAPPTHEKGRVDVKEFLRLSNHFLIEFRR
jgi:hypothetical protein